MLGPYVLVPTELGKLASSDGSRSSDRRFLSWQPRPGGWAWVTEDERERGAAATRTTNNRMELRAVLELRRTVDRSEHVIIQTDSAYVVGVFTQWLEDWRREGMRTSSNAPIKNRDLIEAIAQELYGRQVRFEKFPGHAGHRLNELANGKLSSGRVWRLESCRCEPRRTGRPGMHDEMH